MLIFLHLLPSLLSYVTPILGAAPSRPWDQLNFAPPSRTVRPVTVRSTDGLIQGASNLVTDPQQSAIFRSAGSFVVLDFGQEVGGMVSLNIDQVSDSSTLALSFAESSLFINPLRSDDSCISIASLDSDGVQTLPTPLTVGRFTQTLGEQRGGFRYLTIVSNSAAPVAISDVSVHLTFMPHWDDLRAYTGYFFTRDPNFHDPLFLTKLWYAGAYTVQTNTIDVHQARQIPCPAPHGDMGISSHTELVALNDLLPTKNSLAYSGPPINAMGSDTYICWSLIGVQSYFLYTGDLDFVRTVWSNYTKAVMFLESQVDSTGLMNVPIEFANDWGRDNGQGHNSAANAALYMALKSASELAVRLGKTDLANAYSSNATSIKEAFNRLLWDDSAGIEQIQSISQGLTQFWTDIGPVSPELEDTIIPFVGGFEVQAHFIAGQGERALELLHKEWGYMLYSNISVQSTLLEGYTANGSLFYRSARGYNIDPTDISHAHGWATGPTPALTFHVLGLTITSPRGQTWSVAPVLSGLSEAEGGFETALGWFGVSWSVVNSTFILTVDTPSGTKGVVVLPRDGSVRLDGTCTAQMSKLVHVNGLSQYICVSDLYAVNPQGVTYPEVRFHHEWKYQYPDSPYYYTVQQARTS
ncbi:glycoside hydrolase family 78 protein [Amanita thiersii Skay4041]|uniref:Glycoside hydrolase family 78 protein n=1 Tax=Amanita thiersii Skay4041 TaxID=703135 RepID=A0A2A9NGQ3_9AGAR|nr:glycoside hydrolase family 78 protein [Amanita thiersii Skay4041]